MLKQSLKYQQQKGFTLVGWIIVIFIFLFFAYLTMILISPITNNFAFDKILDNVKNDPEIARHMNSPNNVWGLIERKMIVNQMNNPTKDDMEIVKEGGNKITLYFDYEERVHFAKNIYIVFEHSKSVEIEK